MALGSVSRRYCPKCERVENHRVEQQGNFARWVVCAACGLRNRAYSLVPRTWAGV